MAVDARRTTFLGFQPAAVGDEEIAAVAETIRSGWLTTGPRAAELERRMAEYLEAKTIVLPQGFDTPLGPMPADLDAILRKCLGCLKEVAVIRRGHLRSDGQGQRRDEAGEVVGGFLILETGIAFLDTCGDGAMREHELFVVHCRRDF